MAVSIIIQKLDCLDLDPLVEYMTIINTIGNLHNWLDKSFCESVDYSDINVNSYCSSLNDNIDVSSAEEGRV